MKNLKNAIYITCSIYEHVFVKKGKKLAHAILITWAKISDKKKNLPQVFC